MKFLEERRIWAVLIVIAITFSVAANAFAEAAGSTDKPAPDTVFWLALWIMTSLLFVLVLVVLLGLFRGGWQLSDALSEEAANQPNPLPVGQKPVMVASSSRFIALLGLLIIMVLFLGFGYYILYAAFNGHMDQINSTKIMGFLFSGAIMFAPYLANQLQTAFSSLAR